MSCSGEHPVNTVNTSPRPNPESDAAYAPPKFKRGDTVVTMENDKCKWFTVERVTLDWRKGCCSYQVGYYTPRNHGSHDAWEMFDESNCFLTKQELFDTL